MVILYSTKKEKGTFLMEKLEKAIEICKKYKQEKLLKELQKNKSEELVEQILSINSEQIEECKKKIGKQEETEKQSIENISYIDSNKLTKGEREHYIEIGKSIIEKGSYAVVTMAGGQRNKAWTSRTQRDIFNRNKTERKIFI